MKRNAGLAAAAVIAAVAGAWVYKAMSIPPDPAPAPAPVQPSLKLAATVPTFTMTDREGKPRTLNDWSGRSLIVNFWATWCAPCRREIPLLSQLQRDHAAEGFQVIGIAVDFREDVLKFANEFKIDYPLLIGEQDALDAATAFGIDAIGFPFTIFSDRQGRVVTAHTGELTAPEAEVILGAIRRLDAGADTLEQAQAAIKAGLAALGSSGGPSS